MDRGTSYRHHPNVVGVLEEEDFSALESWRLLFVHADDEKEGETDMF